MRNASTTIAITGGRVLTPDGFADIGLTVAGGAVARLDGAEGRTLDATGLLVLPGIVDIHGDAFERQLMPRPGVSVDPLVALLDTDRQLAAHGITTAYHGVTWSWEPGLRGAAAVRALLDAIEAARPVLSVDTRIHLRHETFNLEAEPELMDWLARGRIDCLAFNDHMADTLSARERPARIRTTIERSGLSDAAFFALADRVQARADAVPAAIERLAEAGRAAGVPMLSHDDPSPAQRAWYRALGCRIAEFPLNQATAEAAARDGNPIIFGAPNVLRGGSHKGNPDAAAMVARALCSVLASDYYYPALLHAPFRLARDGRASLAQAWALASSASAAALGLTDRGRLAEGARADVVLVAEAPAPHVVASLVAGRIVYLAEPARLS